MDCMNLEWNKLYNKDCLLVMKEMPDNFADLAIVDPPYGIGVNHNMGRRRGDKYSDYKKVIWDNTPPDTMYFNELRRVSKNQIIWGANHFISKMPIDSSCWLMWDKGFSYKVSFAQFELAWTSFDGSCKKFDLYSNLTTRIHPTQKPIALYKWLLQNYAKPGDKIIDTHAGSCSSVIAFIDGEFDWIAFEIDPDYYKAALNRINNHVRQTDIFNEKKQEYIQTELI